MLINKKIKDGEYVTLKLSNGEEVFGKLKSSDVSTIILDKPRALGMSPDGRLAMVPYVQTGTEGETPFNQNHVLSMVLLRSEVKSDYIQATTGLAVAPGPVDPNKTSQLIT